MKITATSREAARKLLTARREEIACSARNKNFSRTRSFFGVLRGRIEYRKFPWCAYSTATCYHRAPLSSSQAAAGQGKAPPLDTKANSRFAYPNVTPRSSSWSSVEGFMEKIIHQIPWGC